MEKHGLYGNIMSPAEIAMATDSYNRLMNRCMYGVAGNIFEPGTESFWEINWWDGPTKQGKHVFTNQTIVWKNGVEDVSPAWTGNIIDGKLSMNVFMKLPCCGAKHIMTVPASRSQPLWTLALRSLTCALRLRQYDFLNFPKKDSFSGFWVIAAVAMGKPIIMIFSLDPHVAPALVDAEIARLQKEHGISSEVAAKITKIAYKKGYKPGDTGEFAFNKNGKPSVIDHSKNANAHQVYAKYPPPS